MLITGVRFGQELIDSRVSAAVVLLAESRHKNTMRVDNCGLEAGMNIATCYSGDLQSLMDTNTHRVSMHFGALLPVTKVVNMGSLVASSSRSGVGDVLGA
jgi:NADP-dependent 3-hydroxy acid dehydrogenase YdfG